MYVCLKCTAETFMVALRLDFNMKEKHAMKLSWKQITQKSRNK